MHLKLCFEACVDKCRDIQESKWCTNFLESYNFLKYVIDSFRISQHSAILLGKNIDKHHQRLVFNYTWGIN